MTLSQHQKTRILYICLCSGILSWDATCWPRWWPSANVRRQEYCTSACALGSSAEMPPVGPDDDPQPTSEDKNTLHLPVLSDPKLRCHLLTQVMTLSQHQKTRILYICQCSGILSWDATCWPRWWPSANIRRQEYSTSACALGSSAEMPPVGPGDDPQPTSEDKNTLYLPVLSDPKLRCHLLAQVMTLSQHQKTRILCICLCSGIVSWDATCWPRWWLSANVKRHEYSTSACAQES